MTAIEINHNEEYTLRVIEEIELAQWGFTEEISRKFWPTFDWMDNP